MAYRQRQNSHGSNYYHDVTLRLAQTSKDSITDEISSDRKMSKWTNSFEFSFACLGFSLNLHSLWLLPLSVIQNGGVTFLLMYLVMVAVCGAPLLLMEMTLGQYSGMATTQLFYHLCPLLSGLGVCQSIYGLLTIIQSVAVMTWISQAMFLLFKDQNIGEKFLYEKVLNKEDHNIHDLGSLNIDLVIVLGIVMISLFVLVGAGLRSVGKVSMVTVPACFMLIIALTIRSCWEEGGAQAILTFLRPKWGNLKSPCKWIEACCQAIFSFQLGSGVISTYSSYNKFYHNIVRDCCIIVAAHVIWITCSLVLCFSLLGVAQSPANVGNGIWLVTITLLESGLVRISNGWLWAGLLFILLILLCVSTVLGYLHVITTTLQCINSCLSKCQPMVFLFVICIVFALDLLLMTQGGIHIYHLLYAFILQWPTLFFSLLTVLAAIFCHGIPFLVTDIADMSKMVLPHWVTCHLAVDYYSVQPILTSASLGYFLYSLHHKTLNNSLEEFSMSFPENWGIVLGWCLAILPLTPLIMGILGSLVCKIKGRGQFKAAHLLQPSDSWYSNEHLSASSPPLDYQSSVSSPDRHLRAKQRFHSEC